MNRKISVITPVRADSTEKVQWLAEAIKSVMAQDYTNWEMVIVNDHSTASFGSNAELSRLLQDPRVDGRKLEDPDSGVSKARNAAATAATGELLLPLDADDLLPENAMSILLAEFENEPDKIIYGHTKLLQNDSQRIHQARPYNYELLLKALMMPVGSLHTKASWQDVGGWDPRMDGGLEDWEYWVRMGKAGYCGQHVPQVTYIYRRHPNSRISYLRKSGEYDTAYAKMREIHEDVYNGRFPVNCCSGVKIRRNPAPQPQAAQQMASVLAMSESREDDNLAHLIYVGRKKGGWGVNGKASGLHYRVQGPGKELVRPDGRLGVNREDVPHMLLLDRGMAFQEVR